jgi:hypothetical protein
MEKIIDVTVQKFNTQIFRADYSRHEDEEENTGERVTNGKNRKAQRVRLTE